MKQPEYTAGADAGCSTEENQGDERRELLLSTVLTDLTGAKILARRAGLVVQKVFTEVLDHPHTGIIDSSWISRVRDTAHGSGEAVALHFAQLEKILHAMTEPEVVNGQIRTSMTPNDIVIFDNEVVHTSADASIGMEQKQHVYMDFPPEWTSGMKDIYLGLCACHTSGRWVSVLELSSWTEIPEEEVQQCLQWLVQARKVRSVGDGSLWKCA